MGQEFTINSQAIENKINSLLPSQAGFGAGIDFSASTTIIPIIDLTETAEGSQVRPDLQTAISHGSATVVSVLASTTTTIANTPGYWRFQGNVLVYGASGCQFKLNDGTTDKIIFNDGGSPAVTNMQVNKDFIVYLTAGDSLIIQSGTSVALYGNIRQIATLDGTLVNPI